ncbi:hypothetical protein ACFL24_01540 [Patescibacteria group bacterium]
MLNRKLLVGTVLLLAFGLTVTAGGCSWFDLSKDKQKEVLQEATDAFQDIDSYKLEGTMKQKNSEFDLELVKAGSDVSFDVEASDAVLKVVQKGNYVYLGNKTEWLRYEDTSGSETGNLSDQFEGEELVKDFDTNYVDDGKMVYEGKESIDGKSCHKFTYTEIGDQKATGILWVTVSDKKIEKIETTENETGTSGTLTFSYDDVTVKEPSDYTEVDITTDYAKVLEIMGDFMQANPDFGS